MVHLYVTHFCIIFLQLLVLKNITYTKKKASSILLSCIYNTVILKRLDDIYKKVNRIMITRIAFNFHKIPLIPSKSKLPFELFHLAS